jgi:hypothetical protein
MMIMKKDIFDEFTELDEDTVEKMTNNSPMPDEKAKQRILERCLKKDTGEEIGDVVSGTEPYRRPIARTIATAAAAVLLVLGGIGGAFAISRRLGDDSKVVHEGVESTNTSGRESATNSSGEQGNAAEQTTGSGAVEPTMSPVSERCFNYVQYIRTNGWHDGEKYPKTVLIRDTAELESYIAQNRDKYNLDNGWDGIPFVEAVKKYDSDWFDAHDLAMVLLEECSGSITHKVTSVENNCVSAERHIPYSCTDDMAEWHILIEVDKSVLDDDFGVKLSEVLDYEPEEPTESTTGAAVTEPASKGGKTTVTTTAKTVTTTAIKVTEPITTTKEYGPNSIYYIRTNGYNDEVSYPKTVLIRDISALNSYIAQNKGKYDLDNSWADVTFVKTAKKYDSEWFSTHDLAMVLLEESSGSVTHKVASVEGGDLVVIERYSPEVGTADMAEWHILIEVDKGALVNNFGVKLRDFNDNVPEEKTEPDPGVPDVYLTVLKPVTGYWTSTRTAHAYYRFGADGKGSYYDSTTCWGYDFHYTYDQNAGKIEYAAYNADGTLSDTQRDKGTVYFTNKNIMAIAWEKGCNGVQGVMEYFTPADAMPE